MSTLATQHGDFRCSEEATHVNLAIFIMYSSIVIAFVLLTFFGECIGRKSFILVGLITAIAGILFAILAPNIILAAVGLLIGLTGA